MLALLFIYNQKIQKNQHNLYSENNEYRLC